MTVELSSSFSSEDWPNLKTSKDKKQIITVLRHRYEERYFAPFENNDSKHGFSMMAISCLVIESLCSLLKGWDQTDDKGAIVFEEYFSNSKYLTVFSGHGAEFYSHIRCGILHQAETTGGWKIRRASGSPLFSENEKIIHATKFMNALKNEFDYILETLEKEEFDSRLWMNVITKIDYLVLNCG